MEIIAHPNEDIPVFTVKKGNSEDRTRTLHRNFLLPVGFLNNAPPTPAPRKSRTIKPVTRQFIDEEHRAIRKEESTKSDSEDDSVWGLVIS